MNYKKKKKSQKDFHQRFPFWAIYVHSTSEAENLCPNCVFGHEKDE